MLRQLLNYLEQWNVNLDNESMSTCVQQIEEFEKLITTFSMSISVTLRTSATLAI